MSDCATSHAQTLHSVELDDVIVACDMVLKLNGLIDAAYMLIQNREACSDNVAQFDLAVEAVLANANSQIVSIVSTLMSWKEPSHV